MNGSRRENHGKQPAPEWGRCEDMEGKRNIIEEAKTTSSLILNKLWDMRDACGHDPGEQLAAQMLGQWASGLELEGRKAQQLGSLTRDHLTHKVVRKGPAVCSLWRQLMSSMNMIAFINNVNYQGQWTTAEESI